MNFIYLNKILLENLFLKFKLMSKITQDPDPGSEQKLSEKSDPDTDPKKSFRIHNTVKNSEQFQKCIQKAQRRHGGKRLGWHRDENHSGSRDILRDPSWAIGRKSTSIPKYRKSSIIVLKATCDSDNGWFVLHPMR